MVVAGDLRGDPVAGGGGAEQQEQAGRLDTFGCAGSVVAQREPFQMTVATAVDHLGVSADGDARVGLDLTDQVVRHGFCETVAPHRDGDRIGEP